MTDTGYFAGTTMDGGLQTATAIDEPCRSATSFNSFHKIENLFINDSTVKVTSFETVDRRAPGDGIADWFDFDPTGENSLSEFSFVFLSFRNDQTGDFGSGFYQVNSFRPIITSIVIDGVDTGIADFEYEGTLVSELIQQATDNAKNHGKFVSNVSKITNKLKKSGLITGTEKDLIMEIAAESSVGKK